MQLVLHMQFWKPLLKESAAKWPRISLYLNFEEHYYYWIHAFFLFVNSFSSRIAVSMLKKVVKSSLSLRINPITYSKNCNSFIPISSFFGLLLNDWDFRSLNNHNGPCWWARHGIYQIWMIVIEMSNFHLKLFKNYMCFIVKLNCPFQLSQQFSLA